MSDIPPPPADSLQEKRPFLGGMGNIFTSKPKDSGFELTEVVSEVTNVSRRLRIIEEHQTNFRKKMQVVEQNMIANHKKLSSDIKTLSAEISEMKNLLHEMENKMLMFIKELRMCAKKDEVQVIQKYLAYWEPLNFVTQKQFEEALLDRRPGSENKVAFPQNL